MALAPHSPHHKGLAPPTLGSGNIWVLWPPLPCTCSATLESQAPAASPPNPYPATRVIISFVLSCYFWGEAKDNWGERRRG